MTTSKIKTLLNGTNGTSNGTQSYAEEQSPDPVFESIQNRRALAVLGVSGNYTDAQALYFAMPGSTADGWSYFQRLIDPVRHYVLDGDPLFLALRGEYVPVMTPQGDCQDDSLPLEQRNQNRAAIRAEMEGPANPDPDRGN